MMNMVFRKGPILTELMLQTTNNNLKTNPPQGPPTPFLGVRSHQVDPAIEPLIQQVLLTPGLASGHPANAPVGGLTLPFGRCFRLI